MQQQHTADEVPRRSLTQSKRIARRLHKMLALVVARLARLDVKQEFPNHLTAATVRVAVMTLGGRLPQGQPSR